MCCVIGILTSIVSWPPAVIARVARTIAFVAVVAAHAARGAQRSRKGTRCTTSTDGDDMFLLSSRPRVVGISLLLATTSFAQQRALESAPRPASGEVAGPQHQDRDSDPYARLDVFVGARLRLASESVSAGDKDASGANNNSERSSITPRIAHLIVDASDGSIDFAAITTGDWLGAPPRQILVPMTAIQLDRTSTSRDADAKPTLILSATRERVATLPAYDDATIAKRELADVVHEAQEAWERPPTAKAEEDGARPASASRSKSDSEPPRWVMGERVRSIPPAANDEKLGSITECIVDRECQRIRFLVVADKEANLLVPFSAFRLTNRSDQLTWLLDLPCKQVHEHGVAYEKPSHGIVDLAAATKALGAYKRSEANVNRDQKR